MTSGRVAGIALLLCCISTHSVAKDNYSDLDFEVRSPFESQVARTNFKKCYEKTTDEELKNLKRIVLWKYGFSDHTGCPPGTSDCDPTTTFFRLRRTIHTDASEGNPSRVEAAVGSQGDHSCTSPREFSDFSANISRKEAAYSVHGRQRKRVCVPFDGSWTVGEGTADISFGGRIATSDLNIRPFKLITNERGRLLGIFDGNLVGALLAATFLDFLPAFSALLVTFQFHELTANLSGRDFLGTGLNLMHDIENSPLGKIGSVGNYEIVFKTQIEDSGFLLTGDDLKVEVFQDGFKPKYLENEFRIVRKLEIDFLKSLSEVGPEKYTVKRGDNLWNLAKQKYGDGRFYLYLESYAGRKKGSALRVGEVLKLPRWYELCEKLKTNGLLVREHESLWLKGKAGQIPYDLKRVTNRSNNPNLIFPHEILSVAPAP